MGVDDYEYDVFVSYRRLGTAPEWVAKHFHNKFDQRLADELGRAPKIFWDETDVQEGNRFEETILSALSRSRCLVAILSRPYFSSTWCLAEWATFEKRAKAARRGAAGLAVPVQLHDSDKFALKFKTFDFKDYRYTGRAWEGTEGFVAFQASLNELAERVAEVVDDAPAFDTAWDVVHPEAVEADESVFWSYVLKKPGDG